MASDSDRSLSEMVVEDRILDIIAEQGVIRRELLQPNVTLDDLGVQSIDVVMILNEIEEVFGIYVPIDHSLSGVKNVGQLVGHISKLVKESGSQSAGSSQC